VERHAGLDVVLDLGAERAAADRELDADGDVSVGATATCGTIPSDTMSDPSSGSTTERRRSMTSASAGGAAGRRGTGMIVRACGVTITARNKGRTLVEHPPAPHDTHRR
jgi:hypothetical protein